MVWFAKILKTATASATAAGSDRRRARSWLPLVAAVACLATFGRSAVWAGERRLPESELKDGQRVHEAFRSVVARVNASTVAVLSGGRQIALGVIVSPDGFILTRPAISPTTCSAKSAAEA